MTYRPFPQRMAVKRPKFISMAKHRRASARSLKKRAERLMAERPGCSPIEYLSIAKKDADNG